MRATQDLAELTRRQQAASERPVLLQQNAAWSGSPGSGTLEIALLNVGLGPALDVRVDAEHVGHPDWQPRIDPARTAVILPGTGQNIGLFVSFPEPHNRPGGVVSNGFEVAGTYLDRSMLNRYEIITTFPED